MKKLKISVFEIVWYSICAIILLWGLTYVVLGCLAKYLPIPNDKNPLFLADASFAKIFGLGFFGWGLIIIGIGALAAVLVLILIAKRADRDTEKAARRAARLSRTNMFTAEENPQVVDAKFEEK